MLGMAFANADALFQIHNGRIEYVLGAIHALTGRHETDIIGSVWRDWVAPDDQELFRAAAAGVEDGIRRGPFIIRFGGAPERVLQATLRKSPTQPDRICCALIAIASGGLAVPKAGLLSRPAFEQMAERLMEIARQTGQGLELAFIDIDAAQAADAAAIAGGLRAESYYGAAAGELGGGRYAVLRTPDGGPQALARRLSRVLATDVAAQIVRIEPCRVGQAIRGVRLALDRFVNEGATDLPATISELLEQAMKATLGQASAVRELIEARRFSLAFQPVVDLKRRRIAHHEVLVRFNGMESPAAQLEMAEAFDLIGDLDRAVLELAVARLANSDPSLQFAVNVSGSTISDGRLADGITALFRRFPKARGRLLLEMTETAIVENLEAANRNIQALRNLGVPVCLDDFGAGSASFNYLQHLEVDILKIDGAYIRGLVEDGREAAMIRRLVQLCQDLKIRTVAEMVETQEVEALAIEAGVDYAQGWLYGRAAPEPQRDLRAPASQRARRRGAIESWG
jgi:EAL domain-containing protein (putative c-di-GMP-specific phosphodiesterase class I)